MNEERKALQIQEYLWWQKQRGQTASKEDATVTISVPVPVPIPVPSHAEGEREKITMKRARSMSMPLFEGYNVIDSHINTRLRNLWKSESEWWSLEERRDFIRWVPRARITEQQNSIANHRLARYMRRNNRLTWGHFVILRAMFGASQCARQDWWDEFKGRYERAAEEAPPGVVPRDVEEVLETNRMDCPPIMNIPTMEVEDVHVGEDCGCSWCLEHPAIARRKNKPVSQGRDRVAKTEPQLECSREQGLYTGGEESHEDRVERIAREAGVEPEETPEGEGIDEKISELVIRVPPMQEKRGVVSTDLSNGELREIVLEQGGVIEVLAQLLKEQRKRTEMLAAKVEKVERGVKRNKRDYREIRRKVKSRRVKSV